ncbi:MAG: ribokinase, partial [bacterium]
LIGAVGDDPFGLALKKELRRFGVIDDFVAIDATVASGVAIILLNEGDNRIIIDPGANLGITPRQIDAAFDQVIERGDLFLTQFETNYDAIRYGILKASTSGMKVIVNPAPAVAIDEYLYRMMDLVILNRTEIQSLTGMSVVAADEARPAMEELRRRGVDAVILTLGEQGSVLLDGEGSHFVSALPVQAIDTTGAGDAYIGAICQQLASDVPIRQAMKFATVTAGLTVTKKGVQAAIPTREEIERQIEIGMSS